MEIEIDDMGFGYDSVPVLKDICLHIRGPQLISILGPNGVGKSTLIHCMNKLLSPSKGKVLIDGEDVETIDIRNLAKKMSYVPYTSPDTFPLTVVDTVMLGRHPHINLRTSDHDLEVVYETLKKLGIEDLAMRFFNELSAGQRQKVILARGLVQEPRLLLLDEPTSNLDIKHQLGITRLMMELAHDDGLTVVMISHDINIAARYSDYIIMMHDGIIFDVGTPSEVITEDNLRTVYGVSTKIVESEGRPHVILLDPGCDASIPDVCGSVCVDMSASTAHSVGDLSDSVPNGGVAPVSTPASHRCPSPTSSSGCMEIQLMQSPKAHLLPLTIRCLDTRKNAAVHARRTTRDTQGNASPSMTDLTQSVVCVRGSSPMTSWTGPLRLSSENMVPHRKVIGSMTRDVNRLSARWELASIPHTTPSRLYIMQEKTMTTTAWIETVSSSLSHSPIVYRTAQLMSPRTAPAYAFPRIMADGVIEHRNSSSKLW